jgi:hypothetical protein
LKSQHVLRSSSSEEKSRPLRRSRWLGDQCGLTTLEYAVLFILILIGALALWTALGRSLRTQVDRGETTLISTLDRARVGEFSANRAAGGAQIGAAPATGSATATGAPLRPGTAAASPSAVAVSPSAAAVAPGPSSSAAPPSAANPSVAATSSRVSPANSSAAGAAPPTNIFSTKLGTAGKVLVAAAGAIAGAGLAAGTSVATTYASTALCGPAVVVCAGAVTVGLAAAGGYAMYKGGWAQLKGAFGRTFSSEQATVGDALSVGMTVGGVAYGVAEAAGAVRVPGLASGAGTAARSSDAVSEVGGSVAALERSAAPPSKIPSDVYHATLKPEYAQGIVDGINPKVLNAESRFGKAFYVAEHADTSLAEMAHHQAVPTHGIRFQWDASKARVLDLTDPATAAKYGYTGGPITDATKAIGTRALDEGFNAIRYPSLRGQSNNIAVLKDFDALLKPQMITPIR